MEMPPPGWYDDPAGAGGLLRWWDGTQWTGQTAAAEHAAQAPASPLAIEAAQPRPAATAAPEPAEPTPAASWSAEPTHPGLAAQPAHPVEPARPGGDGQVSLTEWFESIPVPGPAQPQTAQPQTVRPQTTQPQTTQAAQIAEDTRPAAPARPALEPAAADNSTRVLDREAAPWAPGPAPWEQDAGATLAAGSWPPDATLASARVTPIWEPGGAPAPAPPPQRNRTRLMWALALATAVAVLVTGGLVAILGSSAVHPAPAAAVQHPAAVGKLSPSPSPSASAPSAAATTGTPVTDAASGLSYAMFGPPWQAGCPTSWSNSAFTWTGGESAVAGTVGSGGNSAWYASACSGPLGQQYPYTGVADLAQTATNLVNAFDPAYYNGLPHSRAITENNPLQVSGHPAWIVKFMMTYPTAASHGVPWQAEMGAVVVADRGAGQAPAVLFVTVPDNLGLSSVDVVLQSLQLSARPATTAPAATPPAGAPPAGAPPGSPPAPPGGGGAAGGNPPPGGGDNHPHP